MKVKRVAGVLVALLLCVCLLTPVSTDAAAKVRVRTVKGVTSSYSGRKTSCYVNGKKIGLTKTPIFKKSGAYMGPVSAILKNSSLKVKVKSTKKTLTLTYGPNTVVLKADSRKAVTNGVSSKMGAAAIHGTYTATGKKRWIVPLNSVCTRLGISYKLSGGKIRISGTTQSAASTTAPIPTTTETRTPTVSTKEKIKIVIDAGHGGSDSGATGNGMAEKNLTLAIVLAAKKSFDNDSRFQVSYTRTADTYPSLSQRANLANNKDADMFLCVHINSASASAHGTETLWSKGRNSATQKNGLTSKELATAMQSAAVAATGFTNRGLVDRPNLYVLKHTKMPACLIEYGFISNKTEASRMKANTSVYGKALYNSVVNLMKKEGRY